MSDSETLESRVKSYNEENQALLKKYGLMIGAEPFIVTQGPEAGKTAARPIIVDMAEAPQEAKAEEAAPEETTKEEAPAGE